MQCLYILLYFNGSSWHHELVSTKWIGNIEEYSTLSTNMLFIIAWSSNTSCAVHGCGVSTTLWGGLSLEPDIATLAPARPPAVPHNPVVALSLICSVSNKLHCVVQGNVGVEGAAIVDTTSISSPSTSVHGNSKGSLLCKVGHDCFLVVGGHGVVSSDSHHRSSVHEVVHAVPGIGGGSGGVGVVILSDVAEQLDVGVSKLGNRAHAAPSSTTLERVGGAGGHLLGGKDWCGAVHGNPGVGLDHCSGGECPAGAALSLVLDISDDSMVPPVDLCRKVLGWLGLGEGLCWGGGHPLVSSKVHGFKLSLCQVTELVHGHFPGGSGQVVLCPAQVSLAKLLLELSKLYLGVVSIVSEGHGSQAGDQQELHVVCQQRSSRTESPC